MILFTNKITPRLKYITDFIGREITGAPIELTTSKDQFSGFSSPKINYSDSRISPEEIYIQPAGLLFENNITGQDIQVVDAGSYNFFFKTEGDYPFDIFSASFYLLSRYEEYLPHKKDMYGRYAHENSIAFNEKFLNKPLVNIWISDFKKALLEKFPSFTNYQSSFTFHSTYDIDEAFAYLHKGILNKAGGLFRSLLKNEWDVFRNRVDVLTGKEPDPYDSYAELDKIHDQYNLKPTYFFHIAEEQGKYDKNLPPSLPVIQHLIKKHAAKYSIGLHPSWKSGDDNSLLEKELRNLEKLSDRKITSSRQHYIRFTLPGTYRKLIKAGITDDYSMGYGSINGFRASVTSSFFWYDLEKDEQTNLLLHPFCFMDANSFFEQKYLPQRAFEEMMNYLRIVKSVQGEMITIWHNNFLGTYPLFTGWKEVYRDFLSKVSKEY